MKEVHFFRKPINLKELTEYTEERKKSGIKGEAFNIYKTIELESKEYGDFTQSLLADRDFIAENKKLSGVGRDKIWNCIYVKQKGSKSGILVNCEGYDYARYTALYTE